jgi:hypothetical protein
VYSGDDVVWLQRDALREACDQATVACASSGALTLLCRVTDGWALNGDSEWSRVCHGHSTLRRSRRETLKRVTETIHIPAATGNRTAPSMYTTLPAPRNARSTALKTQSVERTSRVCIDTDALGGDGGAQ